MNIKIIKNLASINNYIFLVIITIGVFYFYISSQNNIVGWIADDAVYLLMADYYSPYSSSLNLQSSFVMQIAQFPPLYPWLLAIIGAGSENIFLAHLFTTGCFVVSLAVYAYWVSKDSGSRLAGACLSLLFICLPVSLLMIVDLWSEHLYIMLTLLALLLVEKAKNDKKYRVPATIIIGFLPLARITGITFVAAYIVYLYINKINHRYKYIALSVIPVLLWIAFSIDFKIPRVHENTLTSYYQGDIWLTIKDLFLVQLPELWNGWHACFDIQKNLWSGVLCACILLLVLASWGIRLRKKKLDSIYLLFYLALIWLFPFPAADYAMRYMFVVMPVLLYYSYLSLSSLLMNYVKYNFRVIVHCAAMFVALTSFFPTSLYAINRLFAQMPPDIQQYRYTKYWLTEAAGRTTENSVRILSRSTQSYIEAAQYIPADKCAYAVHYEEFMFYAHRLALPLPLPAYVGGNSIIPYLDECEYIHINNTNSHPYVPVAYPIDLLGGNFDYIMLTRMSEDTDSPIVGALIKLH